MKKKVLIIGAVVLIFILLVLRFTIFGEKLSTITLDINPSIELKINKKDEVKSVTALNEDAKEIVDFKFNNMKLDEVVTVIADNVVEKGYAKEDEVTILVHSSDSVNNEKVKDIVNKKFTEKEIATNVIVIENISKEDEKLAKKYNISPAKAAYVNEIKKENEDISTENLIEKDVRELDNIKETGNYCDSGYTLRGNECFKEISKEPASKGNVCPRGYSEYEGICYEEVGIEEKEESICVDAFSLKEDKCVLTETIDSEIEYKCNTGELMKKGDVNPIGSKDNDKYYCIDKSTGKAPTLRCLTNSGHIMIGGVCYNGPAPLINGGCPGSDVVVNGWCYSKDTYDQYVCPDGNIYEKSKDTYVSLCPDTFTYTEPEIKGYKCSDGFKLEDKKCIKEHIQDVLHERYCKDGYTLVNNDRCINMNNTIEKQDGYVCSDNSILEGNMCITYEIIKAKQND